MVPVCGIVVGGISKTASGGPICHSPSMADGSGDQRCPARAAVDPRQHRHHFVVVQPPIDERPVPVLGEPWGIVRAATRALMDRDHGRASRSRATSARSGRADGTDAAAMEDRRDVA
jgi:hypothetical protein